MKNLLTLLFCFVAASTFAQRGTIYPVVTTSVIPVSLSSNSIYDMIITYGGGGGGSPLSLTNLDTRGWTNNTGIYGNGVGLTNLTFGGNTTVSNLTVTGTMLAGNWASAMNPGSHSIYNVRSDTGTSAGTVSEATITANGALPWIGLQGTADDTGTQTGKVFNVYFPITLSTNYVAGNFIPVTSRVKIVCSNEVIYGVSSTKTNVLLDLR